MSSIIILPYLPFRFHLLESLFLTTSINDIKHLSFGDRGPSTATVIKYLTQYSVGIFLDSTTPLC